jgi:hypothetical protein
MIDDEKVPLFVFRRRSADLLNDHSQDFVADIVQVDEKKFYVMDSQGNHHQLQKDQYRLFNNYDIQFVLVDVHMDQSRWLLVDTWKQCGKDGYEIAFYHGDAIQEATAEAKRRNKATVYPTLEQGIECIRQIMVQCDEWMLLNSYWEDEPSLSPTKTNDNQAHQ